MTPSKELQHFIDLARTRVAGQGAVAAEEISRVVMKHISSLDDSAITGLHEFIDLAKSEPTTAGDLLR